LVWFRFALFYPTFTLFIRQPSAAIFRQNSGLASTTAFYHTTYRLPSGPLRRLNGRILTLAPRRGWRALHFLLLIQATTCGHDFHHNALTLLGMGGTRRHPHTIARCLFTAHHRARRHAHCATRYHSAAPPCLSPYAHAHCHATLPTTCLCCLLFYYLPAVAGFPTSTCDHRACQRSFAARAYCLYAFQRHIVLTVIITGVANSCNAWRRRAVCQRYYCLAGCILSRHRDISLRNDNRLFSSDSRYRNIFAVRWHDV